jgi:hypothetical protein
LPNQVKVKANGSCIQTIEMPAPGKYEILVPNVSNSFKPTEIVLRFAKALPRDDHGRRLVCRLVDVRYEVVSNIDGL